MVIGEYDIYSFNNNHVIDIFHANQERNFPEYSDSEITQLKMKKNMIKLNDKNEGILMIESDKELNEEVSLFY